MKIQCERCGQFAIEDEADTLECEFCWNKTDDEIEELLR